MLIDFHLKVFRRDFGDRDVSVVFEVEMLLMDDIRICGLVLKMRNVHRNEFSW